MPTIVQVLPTFVQFIKAELPYFCTHESTSPDTTSSVIFTLHYRWAASICSSVTGVVVRYSTGSSVDINHFNSY